MYRINKFLFALFVSAFLILPAAPLSAQNQQPLTDKEFVKLLYMLPRNPQVRDELIEEIRRRGIGFALTDGMRGLVSTKSGNDALLRRTLEEAERRRVNPTASSLPSEAEARELLERTRNVTIAAANAMPDFLVKQIIRRSYAYGDTGTWKQHDNITLAVGFRANGGEEYRLLTLNGMPVPDEVRNSPDYSKYAPGATSSGPEYVTSLANLFKPETEAEFKVIDTDTIQTRRTVVYEYVVKKDKSTLQLISGGARTHVGSRGRVWIDRELDRVLRFEQIATEIPGDFPMLGATSLIDYDWVMINERKYLLPTHSIVLLKSREAQAIVQDRNDIRFRNYQKYGAELKVIDEIDEDAPAEPEPPPVPKPKPDKPIRPPQ
ncbi:MAG TPA: hypothetical protein VFY51_09380 [Pyrinomonadaceae bacterium]|nr:hypothetical protein [Pyrinomonadaceae bacterium]